MKIARLFSGFDGAGEGIRDAGYELSWAIEKDAKIADVARVNGHSVITADILDVDPSTLERPDGFHASTVCTNASLANSTGEVNEDGTKETKLDRDCAMKTVQFVEVLKPRLFTLENVWAYRKFQSFAGGDKCEGILPALKRLGYKVDYWHLNAADYGVPQTRKRLILVASLDFMPQKPWETHYDTSKPELSYPTLFGSARRPWVGWYEAIEDLIPTLPESQFAPWQLSRLPEELKTSIFSQDYGSPNTVEDRILNVKDIDEPLFTLKAQDRPIRAFLVNTREMHHGDGITAVSGDTPAYTLPATSTGDRHKAWLSQGRVVKMSTRALARFQSFSDAYRLSGSNTLDCKGIGNACPPRLFKEVYGQLREAIS